MSTIFGFIFVIFIIILLIGFSIVSGILKLLFGLGRKRSAEPRQENNYENRSYRDTRQRETFRSKKKSHKKVFEEDEGEYIDFEEVKNEKDK